MWIHNCFPAWSRTQTFTHPPPPPRRKNVWGSKQTFLSQTPRLLIINLACDWSLYIRYISNFHSNSSNWPIVWIFIEPTSWQLYRRTKSCNLIGLFGIPKRKGVCDEKVWLEYQTFFRRGGGGGREHLGTRLFLAISVNCVKKPNVK